MTFWISQFSTKHFLISRYEFANDEWVDNLTASQFSIYFVNIKFWKFSFLAQTCKSISPYQNILYQSKTYSAFIPSSYKSSFTLLLLKYGIFVISVSKIHGQIWGDDINSLICIFISTVQEMFRWKLRKLKIASLPYFLADLHQIIFVPFEKNVLFLLT